MCQRVWWKDTCSLSTRWSYEVRFHKPKIYNYCAATLRVCVCVCVVLSRKWVIWPWCQRGRQTTVATRWPVTRRLHLLYTGCKHTAHTSHTTHTTHTQEWIWGVLLFQVNCFLSLGSSEHAGAGIVWLTCQEAERREPRENTPRREQRETDLWNKASVRKVPRNIRYVWRVSMLQ